MTAVVKTGLDAARETIVNPLTMADVRAASGASGYTVASLFAGGGGSSTGYRLAGFRVVYANEFVASARETYAANYPDTYIDRRDVREIHASEMAREIACDIDVLDGSPPCSSFSSAGKQSDHWGHSSRYSDDVEQRTDDLFGEYARLLRELQPRAFVAENVAGLTRGVSKGMFKDTLRALESAGYHVRAAVCDAQWLGVPQARERLIFIGVRADLMATGIAMLKWHPAPDTDRVFVRDVLPYVTHVQKSRRTYLPASGAVSPTIVAAGYGLVQSARYSAGGFVKDQWTPNGRKLMIDELKALATFPRDYILTGTAAQQWERIGRAVPPRMMQRIAERVRTILETIDGTR